MGSVWSVHSEWKYADKKNNGIQVINDEAYIYNAGFLLEDDVRYTGKKNHTGQIWDPPDISVGSATIYQYIWICL